MKVAAGSQNKACWNKNAFDTYAKKNPERDLTIACHGCVKSILGPRCTAYMIGDTNPTSETAVGEPVDIGEMDIPRARILAPQETTPPKSVTLPSHWLDEMV